MDVMVIGGGGREHAIIRKLKESKDVETIYAMPGNAGMKKDAVCTGIGAEDLEAVLRFTDEHRIDYAVVTPDDPLVMGFVDELNKKGIPCFGPDKKAAIIEGSKAFSKNLMKKYDIPTAEFETFTDMDEALTYVKTCKIPVVVKADGLAKGKGVLICRQRDEAEAAVREMMADMKFGKSGQTVVIEEFLEGPEVTVLSFTDGNVVVPMISSMDHKRAFDNDEGLNTGGMGTVAPNPYYTDDLKKQCMEEIFIPTMEAMKKEGRTFKGCLYFGLMLTEDGPRVIEYNCRFGDPETQVVIPLLDSDLFDIMRKVTEGRLKEAEVNFSEDSTCCVVMATEGYPKAYKKGYSVEIPKEVEDHVYVAGLAETDDGSLVSSGGRVLGITERGASLDEAIKKAYRSVERISFDHGFYRSDIGRRALAALKGE